ncbi:hypothetical protein HYU07_05315 [Candidatus Woesearchaeota archaeon]|nr:hypothetical protein [Candidatus Woesearchaeota archaeon]
MDELYKISLNKLELGKIGVLEKIIKSLDIYIEGEYDYLNICPFGDFDFININGIFEIFPVKGTIENTELIYFEDTYRSNVKVLDCGPKGCSLRSSIYKDCVIRIFYKRPSKIKDPTE